MEKPNPLKESLGNGMRNLWDLMVVNWLWFLCSLPVVTVGPATCALYGVALKLARNEPVYAAKDFFRFFRENLKPALVLGLLVIVLLTVSAGDIYFALQLSGSLRTLYLVLGMVLAAVALTVASYGFALQAMFENPLKIQLVNVFKLAVLSPGKTLSLWMITILPVLLIVGLPLNVVAPLGFLYLICGASGPAYLNSRTLRGVFDKVNGSPVVPQ